MKNVKNLRAGIIGQLVVVLLPLAALLVYQTTTTLSESAGLERSYRLHIVSNNAKELYKRFMDGVVDAVDTGRLAEDAVKSLADATAEVKRLDREARTRETARLASALAGLLAQVGSSREFDAIASMRETITGIDRDLAMEDARYERAMRKVIEASISSAGTRRTVVYSAVALIGILTACFIVVFSRNLANPLLYAVDLANRIAGGELTPRGTGAGIPDIGTLMSSLRTMRENLSRVVGGVQAAAATVVSSSAQLSASSRTLREAADTQCAVVGATTHSTDELNASIKLIADDAGRLFESTASASASSLEISASIEEVADQTRLLDGSADQTLEAVNRIALSARQVAENVAFLSVKADDAARSVMRIHAKADEINTCSREQEQMAREIEKDARDFGLTAIGKTKVRMSEILVEVNGTVATMNSLGTVSTDIGAIVDIIKDIADRTKLLALNANILAAQAGVHGRSFAVVAHEIKELAAKTAVSTREITDMVQQVQEGTSTAIAASQRSSRVAEEGVKLTREVETALNEIIQRTGISLDKARVVAHSAVEQTGGVAEVTASIQEIGTMVAGINEAAKEQQRAIEEILRATEDMRESTRFVRTSVGSQSGEIQQITVLIQEIHERSQVIARATVEQRKSSEAIVEALETVSTTAGKNADLAAGLDKVISVMDRQAETLQREVGVFSV